MKTIIFDWKRTLYDPNNKSLIKGSLRLLSFLKQKKYLLVLIGKGSNDMYQEIERLDVKQYFTNVFFKEGKKNDNLFKKYVLKSDPGSTIVVGDRVRSEIEVGNRLKSITIWIKQGKFAEELPLSKKQTPTYIVNSLLDLKKLFKNKAFNE